MFELGAFAVLQGEAEEVSLVRNGRKFDCFNGYHFLRVGYVVPAVYCQGFLDHVAFKLLKEREGEGQPSEQSAFLEKELQVEFFGLISECFASRMPMNSMVFTFTLNYQLTSDHRDMDALVERLAEEDCNDGLVGVGQTGRKHRSSPCIH